MANEKRLIDLDEAIDALGVEYEDIKCKHFLEERPIVDAVEVVRCEKCLYRSQYANENGMYKCGGILTEDGECFLMVKPDHFCAFGKQRGKVGAKMDGGNEDD